jgi:HAD superfamily hydrolase (TIGR01509 family)
MFDLTIFDMDGVLVDSEPIACGIFHKHVAALGVPMTLDELMRDTIGLSTHSTRLLIRERYGIEVSDDVVARIRAELDLVYPARLAAVPGVEQAILAIDRPRCVASSSSPTRIELSLRLTGLTGYFGRNVFSASMVERGKPHPDLFLHAAGTMGFEPARAAVIEDSVHGVTAGVAAGMKVFAFAGAPYTDAKALERAGGQVFTDMRDLPALLGV